MIDELFEIDPKQPWEMYATNIEETINMSRYNGKLTKIGTCRELGHLGLKRPKQREPYVGIRKRAT